MASEEIKAIRYTCGGCEKSVIVEQGAVVEGYHGTIELITRDRVVEGEVYACKPGCIKGAVLAATSTGSVVESEPDPDEDPEPDPTKAQEALGIR